MPFINVMTNTAVSGEKKTAIKTALGKAISIIPGKSETWLMVGINPEYTLHLNGNDFPAAMVDVSILGTANSAAYNKLTAQICDILSSELGIDPSRIYVKYSETDNWGWNGGNI